ncbi:MAG: DUF1385 domain-containing protein [Lachnospiraceae bacterium]|nr:DUF1385 domain-containing protein [Lachnospiraceae bacterium]
MSQETSCKRKYSGIGGQAVMEGVMMRNGDNYAVAVRKSDGEIEVMTDEYKGLLPSDTVKKIPLLRGVISFVDSLVLGLKALNFSADFFVEEDEKDGEKKPEKKPEEKDKKSAGEMIMTTVVMIIAMIIAIGLFMVIPYFASLLFEKYIPNPHLLALVEGVIRLLIFIAYIKAISMMNDIKRVFMYHGAEHKCINCIESGKPLTVENVRSSSKEHRRCGTSFLLYVMVISILFFALIDTPDRMLKVVLRIVLIPLIAAVSYEFIRLSGKFDNPFTRVLSMPGLAMQALTTSEPDDEMIEVGIKSVDSIFDWREYLNENFGLKLEKTVSDMDEVQKEA